jgi:hypothetical protein
MENKLFDPNKDKKLFTITIEVFENCASIAIANEDDYLCTYHEIIGIFETQKMGLIMNQREKNLEHFNNDKK